MTTAHDTSACPVLTGPNNFQIWKLRIISKLRREKVLQVVTGEELKPSPAKPTSSEDPEITWILKDEKAHGIIQDHISDALLMRRTGDLTSSKELFDKLVSLHQMSNIALAFYSFQQLTKLSWDGTSPIQDHITKIQTIDSYLLLRTKCLTKSEGLSRFVKRLIRRQVREHSSEWRFSNGSWSSSE
ncbi:hypothetical protein SERLA73DRAFT_72276 [Serpula lacrymans var. lacrymans S7.3]|uniref:Retrotransposon Copia-like N-terminal domain-containing protein n=2 Tax=Serpula lacrymans var. lacrymans TaxID=341189 RepID=F8PSQ2_SERL3|nr:uncharacterized protein SERLADRAFT_436792 [Serpula lacrymans var. lacrymans S7.9]EGO01330.1 hypothetical protein SERLA73DRAFT_72276 [Serpula lacrymans var. lacrymans S7.3]EGO26968.1 hypothetical protein SERLADRAFT_436792 [Serpula lacrymans var. lacrymans S7.9]